MDLKKSIMAVVGIILKNSKNEHIKTNGFHKVAFGAALQVRNRYYNACSCNTEQGLGDRPA